MSTTSFCSHGFVSIHRCTRVENPEEGLPGVFANIPRGGGQGYQEKLPGGLAISGFFFFAF
jgi:hypothetical protein